jgi:hypothetical protein
VIRKGIARGEFRAVNIESSTYCVIAPMVLAMLWQHSFARHDREPLDAKALADTHLKLLLRGFTAEDDTETQAAEEPLRRTGASR